MKILLDKIAQLIWLGRSLTQRLLISIVLFSVIATIAAVTVELYLDYRRDLAEMDRHIENIQLTHRESLARSLWSLNSRQVALELRNVAKIRDVISLKIIENNRVTYRAGRNPADGEKTRSITSPLEFNTHNGSRHVGDFEILVSLSGADQRLFDRLEILIFTQGLQILLVAVFFLFIFHFFVIRHLYMIAEYAKNMNIDKLNHTLDLKRSIGLVTNQDELQTLVNAINQMNKRLANDVSEREQSEVKLRQLQNYLSNVIDSMPSILIGVDASCNVTQWNTEAARLSHVCKSDALGRPLGESFPRLNVELEHVRKAIKLRQQQRLPESQYQLSGITRYEDITIYPLVANGVEGAVIRMDDVSEKRTVEAALRRAQKMEVIGQLTGGIAHDFNNILGIVMGNLQLLQMEFSGNDRANARIESAIKGTQRGADITDRLLRFSRYQVSGPTQTDVNSIIQNMDELISSSLMVSIEVQLHFSNGLWPVNVDPGDLEDTILNLSLNAKDALADGGVLTFRTSNRVLDESFVSLNPGASCGEFVMLSVSDNGTGMSEDVRDKIMEPFFTTKEHGKGTGLGLSMVYGFVQRSGGHIKVHSELGVGTTFEIFLPRAIESAGTVDNTPLQTTEMPRGTETILVLDDELALADIAAVQLSHLGYSILKVLDAEHALDLLAVNNTIDLVFSDIVMPGKIDGYQLAALVYEKYPCCKVLLASGFTKKRGKFQGSAKSNLLRLEKNRLQKPYSQFELANAIRKTLDET